MEFLVDQEFQKGSFGRSYNHRLVFFTFFARGLERSSRPQQGHHNPSQLMNNSHSGHLFWPSSYLLPSTLVLVALYFLQDPLQCIRDMKNRCRKTISLFSKIRTTTP